VSGRWQSAFETAGCNKEGVQGKLNFLGIGTARYIPTALALPHWVCL